MTDTVGSRSCSQGLHAAPAIWVYGWGGIVRTAVVVDRRAHREELERFEACVVRWPLADDCAIWKSAVGADGYGRFWVRRGGQQIMVRAEGFADRHGGEVAAIGAPHR
jgi:hypothetical protein